MIDSKFWEYVCVVLFGSIALSELKDFDFVLLVISRVSAIVFFILRAVCYFKKLKKDK